MWSGNDFQQTVQPVQGRFTHEPFDLGLVMTLGKILGVFSQAQSTRRMLRSIVQYNFACGVDGKERTWIITTSSHRIDGSRIIYQVVFVEYGNSNEKIHISRVCVYPPVTAPACFISRIFDHITTIYLTGTSSKPRNQSNLLCYKFSLTLFLRWHDPIELGI